MTRPGFWIAQAAWWGAYVVVMHFVSLPGLDDTSLPAQLVHIGYKLEKAAAGFIASMILYAAYLRHMPRLRLPVFAAGVLASSFVLGMAWELTTRALFGAVLIDDQLLRATLLPMFVLVAWSALYVSFVYRDQANAEAERALRATALATEAELAMLRYQVNPHFLFNSLNSIRALIDESPASAREMVTQLAELFRYSLRTARDTELTVGDEFTAVRNYLEIQKIRFEDDLDAAAELEDSAARTQLPGFLIHPLVENAVKYGLETSARPLRVRVRAWRDGDRLDVEVTNTGRWLDGEPKPNGNGTGTGLRNLRARLAHLYPGRHQLEVGPFDGGVRARLIVELAP